MKHVTQLSLLLTMMTSAAHGTIIVANAGAQASAGGQTSPSLLIGAQFTSPTVATTLTSVDLPLQQGTGNPNVTLSLFGDSAGLPGSSLATIGSQVVNGHLTYTFTPGSGVPLAASTSYWLVLSCSNCVPSGSAPGITNNWFTSIGVTVAGLAGANAATGLAASSDSGATWGVFANGPTTPEAFIFQVNGDANTGVPEPATSALLGAGLAAAWITRRRLR